jgi:hypothetical protein
VTVTLGYGMDALEVCVTDEGRRHATGDYLAGLHVLGSHPSGNSTGSSAEPGRGIAGMRQRCQLLGRDLTAQPRTGGGFEVGTATPRTDRNGAQVSSADASPPDGRPPIKVLLADDEGLVRSGFKVLLDLEDDITVVGEATTGAEAVERARACHPTSSSWTSACHSWTASRVWVRPASSSPPARRDASRFDERAVHEHRMGH